MAADGQQSNALPVLAGTGQPITTLICEPTGITTARPLDGSLWRIQMAVNHEQNRLTLASGYLEGRKYVASFSFHFVSPGRLELIPTDPGRRAIGSLTLIRAAMPSRYPLLDQKMPWIHEWSLER